MQTQAAAPPPPVEVPAQVVEIRTAEGAREIAVDVPMTARDLRALRNRRENLSDQLISVQSRRKDVADALKTADPAARAGLQDRLAVLDSRIVQLESDIASTGRILTSAPAGLASVTVGDRASDFASGNDDAAFFGGMAMGALLLGAAMFARRLFRGGPRRNRSAVAGVQAEQLTRLEQSIDAIAVEVERISEGQRFTAKLMADGQDRVRRESALRDS